MNELFLSLAMKASTDSGFWSIIQTMPATSASEPSSIFWGIANDQLLAWTGGALVGLELDADPRSAEERMRARWPGMDLQRDDATARNWADKVQAWMDHGEELELMLCGTEFELAVWRLLLKIPRGETRTYGELAAALGRPTAARVVGGAVARNKIAILIPCHRVLPANGRLGGYRWGSDHKRRLLALEGVS